MNRNFKKLDSATMSPSRAHPWVGVEHVWIAIVYAKKLLFSFENGMRK